MNDKRYEDTDFWKLLLDILSAYDEDGDEKIDEEKPKEEVKTAKKEEKEEEKKEEPRNTKPNDWSFTASSSKPVDLDWLLNPGKNKQEPEPVNAGTCSVSMQKLWDLHKSLSETVKRMNELTDTMKSETARWMKVKDGIYSCNACNLYFTQEYRYCPNCGRKMYKALTPSGGKIFGA